MNSEESMKMGTFANFENLSFNEEDEVINQKQTSQSVSENIKRSLVVTPNTFSPSRDDDRQNTKLQKK